MNIRASLVVEKIKEYAESVTERLSDDPYVCGIRWTPGEGLSLYSGPWTSSAGPLDIRIMTSAVSLSSDGEMIIVEGLSQGRIYEIVGRFFSSLNEWEISLARACAENRDADALLSLSSEIFRGPVTVYDNSMRLVSYANLTEDEIRRFYVSIDDRWYISSESWNKSKLIDIPLISKNPSHPIVFHDDAFDIDITECPIRYDGQMIGFITFPHYRGAIKKCHYELIETLARYLGYIMWRDIGSGSINDLKSIFPYDLLLSRSADPLLADHFMHILGWKKGDAYQIILTDTSLPEENLAATLVFLRGSIYAEMNGRTAVILHGVTMERDDALAERLEIILEKENMAAGVSAVFYDLTEAADHYVQAMTACGKGRGRLSFYVDHLSDHMLEVFASEYASLYYLHPLVRKLGENDPTGILRETLYQYILCGRSYRECAEALCIQKPSLKYRLDRIRDIVPMEECLDPVRVLDVLLSLKISIRTVMTDRK